MRRDENKSYIYALVDPSTFRICYVGQARNPISRLGQHIANGDPSNPDKRAWIQSLQDSLQVPLFCILAEVDPGESDWHEQVWISALKNAGEPLFNVAPLGLGIPKTIGLQVSVKDILQAGIISYPQKEQAP